MCSGSNAFSRCSSLLELSASDDIESFRKEATDAAALEEEELWYGRRIEARRMGYEMRTPLMIAASYGSVEIVKHILSVGTVDVNRASGSDGATALDCALAGGAPSSTEIVRLLLSAAANDDSVDSLGNKATDLLARVWRQPERKVMDMILKKDRDVGGGGVEGDEMLSDAPVNGSPEGKKEYPIDLSLPDINNGIYSTDEFRMYTFKVKPCSRAYSHDWTECPFVHPGENARRRDPSQYYYSCVPCPEFRKGSCRNGDACEYAHGVFECWLHPAQYRTRLCKDESECKRRVCFFAHKPEELRPMHPVTGSAMPSPRPSSPPFEIGAMSPLSHGSPSARLVLQASTPPLSPGMGGGVWQNQNLQAPSLQMSKSRLKSTLSARNLLLNMDAIRMEMDELSNKSARTDAAAALAAMCGSRSGKFSHLGSTGGAPNLDEIVASLDPSNLSRLQSLSLKSASNVHPNIQSGFSSPMRNDLQSAISFPLSNELRPTFSSPIGAASSASLGVDRSPTFAAAVMNSRSSPCAKRSQSFSKRALTNRYGGRLSMDAAPATDASVRLTSSMLSDWVSPNGKLDWGIQGEEINTLRESASFSARSNGSSVAVGSSDEIGSTLDGRDMSWVQSLVQDGPSAGWPASEHPRFQLRGGSCDDAGPEILPPWAEQMYLEQEQMVA